MAGGAPGAAEVVMPRSAGALPAFSLTQVDHLGAVSEPCHHIVRVVSCLIGPMYSARWICGSVDSRVCSYLQLFA